ncbi:LysR substrate-binding domain-containing protein [Advenella kashmirensis]
MNTPSLSPLVVIIREAAPLDNPLLKERALTLEKVGQYPFIAYDDTYQISRQILEKMRAAGVSPNVVMRASDSDVIKTYVATGLGVAIIPSVAYDYQTDRSIGAKGLGKAFHRTMACILVRKGSSLRSFTYEFMTLLPSSLTNEVIDAAIKY